MNGTNLQYRCVALAEVSKLGETLRPLVDARRFRKRVVRDPIPWSAYVRTCVWEVWCKLSIDQTCTARTDTWLCVCCVPTYLPLYLSSVRTYVAQQGNVQYSMTYNILYTSSAQRPMNPMKCGCEGMSLLCVCKKDSNSVQYCSYKM